MMINSFETFALEIIQRLTSPVLIINDRSAVVSGNDSGWRLLGPDPRAIRGRPLSDLLVPVESGVRTPITALQAIHPEEGWPPILKASTRYFPRLSVSTPKGDNNIHVMNLEISRIQGSELRKLAAHVFDAHPEWIADDQSHDEVVRLVTNENFILFFRDVTELANYEAHRQELMKHTLDVVVRTLDHYIRNALTPILGYCDLIKRKKGEITPGDMNAMTERVSSHVHLITALLDALQTVRDIHIREPLGADAALIDIEQDLKLRLAELESR